MRAYKVLAEGRSGFTGRRWPLPAGRRPGEWVRATGRLEPYLNGVHACRVAQLPQWLGDEVWIIELGGEVLHAEAALVAERGRLLGPVAGWDRPARIEFARACAGRARGAAGSVEAGEQILECIDTFAADGRAGPAGYWTAVLAGESAAGRRAGPDYDRAFAAERAAQAAWLEAVLGGP
ncbi:MAG: hypothetical protein ACXVQR_05790 [Solirubrobacteraceae bacterium]